MLEIEVKEDSPEKLAAVAGKPTKNYLFATEFNAMVEAINVVTEKLPDKADLVDGKVPAEQLPSYVDDVLEFANLASFPATGESGKIYVALDTNSTYRWGGSAYVQVGGGSQEEFIWQYPRFSFVTSVANQYMQQSAGSFMLLNVNTGIANHLTLSPNINSAIIKVPFDCFISEISNQESTTNDGSICIYMTSPNNYTLNPVMLFQEDSSTSLSLKTRTFTSGTLIPKDSFIHIYMKKRNFTSAWVTSLFLKFKKI